MTFLEFQVEVETNIPSRVHRLQFKDVSKSDAPLDRDTLFEFQDADPGYYGWLRADETWEVCFNGATGTGQTFLEADAAMQADYKNMDG
jgi:hypothetical protein